MTAELSKLLGQLSQTPLGGEQIVFYFHQINASASPWKHLRHKRYYPLPNGELMMHTAAPFTLYSHGPDKFTSFTSTSEGHALEFKELKRKEDVPTVIEELLADERLASLEVEFWYSTSVLPTLEPLITAIRQDLKGVTWDPTGQNRYHSDVMIQTFAIDLTQYREKPFQYVGPIF